ncbi:DNA polymerase III subunit delta' [Marinihelvus fidelis]|uniref:DNA-directed DNA polymerase n=1 Tax=Marinihelvus fidelis TaxID=2613842 RepID=A0A5N0TD67_9GAMM|nr:DNA polymerase III subunit delta' [Marinihelvus fidelis]KAA9132007.1 DNA polymerase III subunit delta' [Marinihelvus fidelis]
MFDTEPWLQLAWQAFVTRLSQDRVPHALLLAGPLGIGKGALARRISAALLCIEPRDNGDACGDCRSCRLVSSGAHPEWLRLERQEDRTAIIIEDLREFTRRISLSCSISPRKVAVVEPADEMNRQTQNALLKTLEEPPGDTVMVLVCHDPSRLPATIRSRCQWLDAKAPTADETREWLLQQDEAKATPELVDAALDASGGRPLLARYLLKEPEVLAGYPKMGKALATVLAAPGKSGAAAGYLAGIPMDLMWTWLSRHAAEALRAALGAGQPTWLGGAAGRLDPACVAGLQRRADRHVTTVVGSSLRQDLLLQDWLLEWGRQRGHDAAT